MPFIPHQLGIYTPLPKLEAPAAPVASSQSAPSSARNTPVSPGPARDETGTRTSFAEHDSDGNEQLDFEEVRES